MKIRQQDRNNNIAPGKRLVFTGFRGRSRNAFAHFVLEKWEPDLRSLSPLRVKLKYGYPANRDAGRSAERFARRLILRQLRRAA